MRHSFPKKKKAKSVHTTTKLKKGHQQAHSDHKDLPHLLSTSVSTHHNPLRFCHSPSTARERLSCCDSRPLGSITRRPGLTHFLAQHVQGHVTTQCHLCQLPILQEKRDLATRPVPSLQEPLDDAFSSSDQASLPAHVPFVPQTRDVTSVSSFFRNYVQGDER